MQNYGNTYFWEMRSGTQASATSIVRARALKNVAWVMDNTSTWPAKTGESVNSLGLLVFATSSYPYNTGYYKPPHLMNKKPARNRLYFDGRIELVPE